VPRRAARVKARRASVSAVFSFFGNAKKAARPSYRAVRRRVTFGCETRARDALFLFWRQ